MNGLVGWSGAEGTLQTYFAPPCAICDPRLWMADIRKRLFSVVCKNAQPEWTSLFTVVPASILPALLPPSIWTQCPSEAPGTLRFECHCQTCIAHWVGWDSAKSFGCTKQFSRDSFGMMVPPFIATFVDTWDPVTGTGSQKLSLEYRWVRINHHAILYPGMVPAVGSPWTLIERRYMTVNALRYLLEGLCNVAAFQRFAVGGPQQLTVVLLQKQLDHAVLRADQTRRQAAEAAAANSSDMDISDTE